MEKLRPTYDLEAIKATLGSVETLAMTQPRYEMPQHWDSTGRVLWKRSPGSSGGCFISR
jgi:hypothetical protein